MAGDRKRTCRPTVHALGLVLALALVASSPAQRLQVERYGVGEGLPSAVIFDLAQDSTGRLWILSRRGLTVYDGRRFTAVSVEPKAPDQELGALEIDDLGEVWTVSRQGGPFVYRRMAGGVWSSLPVPAAPEAAAGVTDLVVTRQGERCRVAVGSVRHGLWLWDGAVWTRQTVADGLLAQAVTALEDFDGRIAVGTRRGLCFLEPSQAGCRAVVGEPRLAEPIVALHAVGRSATAPRLWILGGGWLGYLEAGHLHVVAEGFRIPNLGDNGELLVDAAGGVYFGNNLQAFFLDPDFGLTALGGDQGLPSEGTMALLLDRETNVWVGSSRGLVRIVSRRFESFDQDQDLLEDEVTAILELAPGELLLGHNFGLSFFTGESVETLPFEQPPLTPRNADRVLDMARDAAGNVWLAANQRGLLQLTGDRQLRRRITDRRITSVEVDARERLWVASSTELLIQRDDTFSVVDLGRDDVRFIRWLTAGPGGSLYVSTAGGLLWRGAYDGGDWRQATGPSADANDVYGVLAEPSGEVWVGTRAGLYWLAGERLVPVSAGELEIDRPVFFVLADERGWRWFGTDDGVLVWDGSELRHLSVRQGLAGRETNRGAALVDHRGRVWIGTEHGLSVYRRRYDLERAAAPGVELAAIEVNGERRAADAELRLGPRQNHLVFHPRIVTLSGDEELRIHYFLQGFDDHWQSSSAAAAAIRYTNLPPGSYRFRFVADGAGGPRSAEVSSARIVITPPYWRRPQLIILAAAGLVLAVFGVHGLRTRAIRARAAELERINLRLNQAIAEHRRTEEALSASEERYRSVVTVLSEGIVVYDEDLELVACNRSAERILGLSAEQLANHQIIDPRWRTMHEDGTPLLPDEFPAVRTLSERCAFHDLVMGISKPDGELSWLSINTQPIFHPDTERPVAAVVSFTDVTERKRAAAERERLIAELRAKNHELERFTYTVSHDLKSPLVTIKGFLGYLLKDAAAGDTRRLRRDVERIGGAAEKMARLLDELLELSRIGRLVHPPEQVALDELAREAVEQVAGLLAADGVEVEISPELPVVFGDRLRLLEVLQNLVENAVKFMGEQPTPRIEVGVRHDGDETVCYVRDNGIGIEPTYRERVFGLFERLDQTVDGTGVGLALVKRIVEVHGGRIWIESAGLGKGTTVCFTLPVEEPARVTV